MAVCTKCKGAGATDRDVGTNWAPAYEIAICDACGGLDDDAAEGPPLRCPQCLEGKVFEDHAFGWKCRACQADVLYVDGSVWAVTAPFTRRLTYEGDAASTSFTVRHLVEVWSGRGIFPCRDGQRHHQVFPTLPFDTIEIWTDGDKEFMVRAALVSYENGRPEICRGEAVRWIGMKISR